MLNSICYTLSLTLFLCFFSTILSPLSLSLSLSPTQTPSYYLNQTIEKNVIYGPTLNSLKKAGKIKFIKKSSRDREN
jgi:hypothetical protein